MMMVMMVMVMVRWVYPPTEWETTTNTSYKMMDLLI